MPTYLIGGIPLPGAAVYINHNRLRNRWWYAVSMAGLIYSAIFTLLLAALFQLSWHGEIHNIAGFVQL